MKQSKNGLSCLFKIRSSRLRKSKWSLDGLNIPQARRNGELIEVADSQLLRFVRKLREKEEPGRSGRIGEIRAKIDEIKREPSGRGPGKRLANLYDALYEALFVGDLLFVIVDTAADFDRMNARKGFAVNGIRFRRLLATPGGLKKDTVLFASEELYPTLTALIDNGRDIEVPLVPAKLEAYRALVCSASVPVPEPAGVLVVGGCKVPIESDALLVSESGETPEIRRVERYASINDNSDGCGLISPALSRKWAQALGLDYVPAGYCIRNAFTKGMLYTFDFHAWSKEFVRSDEAVDVWGTPRSVGDCEIVLTESMLKLWRCYDSVGHFLACCRDSGYAFSVAKIAPKRLDDERDLNYQFIQSLHLSDADLDELIAPTVAEIRDVLDGDGTAALLFLNGMQMDGQSYETAEFDCVKALMLDKTMVRDPYVRRQVLKRIGKRMQGAKLGEVRVAGNFSFIAGDPVALCQSLFGLEVTGLLRKGQFYSRYWSDKGVERAAAFRAPMTCHHNIRICEYRDTGEMRRWYRHMDTVTIFNAFDDAAQAMNGADMDGDAVFTTNNAVVLRGVEPLEALVCEQKTAGKKIVEEADLVASNKSSFGDRIGSITNRVTCMFDKLALFAPGSREYETLTYRIKCGQNYQQNAIDRTKGIESRPMPKSWYEPQASKPEPDDDEETAELKRFNRAIAADKKPYFFIYRYPELKLDYDRFMAAAAAGCRNRFGVGPDELAALSPDMLTPDEAVEREAFLAGYRARLPVSEAPSVMNRLCRKMEAALADIRLTDGRDGKYDFARLKSGGGYDPARYKEMAELFAVYRVEVRDYMTLRQAGLADEENEDTLVDARVFREEAARICSNADELCNIVVELCYRSSGSKQFAWETAGETILRNLRTAAGGVATYPVPDPDGPIVYKGRKFANLVCRLKEGETP